MQEVETSSRFTSVLPDLVAVRAAAARIAPHAITTPLHAWPALSARVGAEIMLKCEHLQRSGAFKFRGACNAVWSIGDVTAKRGVVTHSSGNHGAALALAAQTRGIPAHIVVPEGAAAAKIENIKKHAGVVRICAPTLAARERMAAQVAADTGAELVHPYTDPRVIAGQGSVALEMLAQSGGLDIILVPMGGGGLASGCAIAAHGVDKSVHIIAAEPEGAADAMASLRTGTRVTDVIPDTICDGLRGGIGEINFECLRAHDVKVLPVSDAEVQIAMRLVFNELGEIIEPSSATVIAALLRHAQTFAGRRVGAVISGGNVDRAQWPWLHP